MLRKALSGVNITMSYNDHHLSIEATDSEQMSFCIHSHNGECSRMFGHGELERRFTLDSVGTRILHLCSNPNGNVPTIILIPRTLTSHTHAQKNTQVIISIFIFFVFIFLCPFICFHKSNTKPVKVA